MKMVLSTACLLLVVGGVGAITMDDPAIVYSPYNWGIINGTAKTINPGAYFRFLLTGQNVTLHADTSAMCAMGSQIWTRVDAGPLVQHVLGAPSWDSAINVPLGPPFSASPTHLVEVIVKSTTETMSRWAPQSTAVVFTHITLGDTTDVISQPRRKPYNVIIYGDSITEGVRTLGYEGIADDTDRNDAVRDYSLQLSNLLPIEIGVVAFGATGVLRPGSGGVPNLQTTWNLMWEGEPRSFDPAPDLIVYNEGTNDGSGDLVAQFIQIVKNLQGVAPNAKQLLLVPFNGGQRDNLKAVVANISSPNVVLGDTAGFYDGKDGLHPFGYNHVNHVAPMVAGLCAPLLFAP